MDKNRIKGKVKDIAGRAQRQTGEWTGDEEQQAKGIAKQAEGKIQNSAGKIKDAARDTARNLEDKNESERQEDANRTRRRRAA